MIGDGEGVIYIYNQNAVSKILLMRVLQHPPELVYKAQTTAASCIRGLCLSTGGSYMVAGSVDGSLSIFELGRLKQERFTK